MTKDDILRGLEEKITRTETYWEIDDDIVEWLSEKLDQYKPKLNAEYAGKKYDQGKRGNI